MQSSNLFLTALVSTIKQQSLSEEKKLEQVKAIIKSINEVHAVKQDQIVKLQKSYPELKLEYSRDHTLYQEPFFCAVKNGEIEIIKTLLEEKIDPNCQDPTTGDTALMIAAQGNTELVEYLIVTHQVKLELRNKEGNTALDIAADNKKLNLVSYLIKHNALISHPAKLLSCLEAFELDDPIVIGLLKKLSEYIKSHLSFNEEKASQNDQALLNKVNQYLNAIDVLQSFQLVWKEKPETLIEKIKKGDISAFELFNDILHNQHGPHVNALENYLKVHEKQSEEKQQPMHDLFIGMQAGLQNKYDVAFEAYARLAKSGNPLGLVLMGKYYIDGNHVGKDIEKGMQYYLDAVSKGCALANNYIGSFYLNDKHGKHDNKLATEYYNKYPQSISSISQLGYCHLYGLGVDKNINKAGEYFETAAKSGYITSLYNLAHCYYQFFDKDKQNNKISTLYFKQSAELNYSESINMYGTLLRDGNGVKENKLEAVKYFEKAIKKNSPMGHFYLGSCYLYGYGVIKDEKMAVEHYKKSIELDCYAGHFRLAACYLNGIGVTKDEVSALAHFSRSMILDMDDIHFTSKTAKEKLMSSTIPASYYYNYICKNIQKEKLFEEFSKITKIVDYWKEDIQSNSEDIRNRCYQRMGEFIRWNNTIYFLPIKSQAISKISKDLFCHFSDVIYLKYLNETHLNAEEKGELGDKYYHMSLNDKSHFTKAINLLRDSAQEGNANAFKLLMQAVLDKIIDHSLLSDKKALMTALESKASEKSIKAIEAAKLAKLMTDGKLNYKTEKSDNSSNERSLEFKRK